MNYIYSNQQIFMNNITQRSDYTQALTTIKNIMDMTIQKNMQTQDDEMQNKLSKAIINIKTKRIMRIFVSKLRRNMTTLEPCDFTDLDEEKNRDRIEGFHINKHFYNFIIFIALIVLILAMVLSSFEAFIESYRQQQIYSITSVLVLKIVLSVIYFIKFVLKCLNVTFRSGIQKKFLSDIILNYMKNGHFFFDLIMTLLLVAFIIVHNQILAVILFIYCLLMFIQIMNDLTVLQTNYLHSQAMNLYWDLLKIAIFNLMFAHFLSSLLFAMSEINKSQNWLVGNGIQNQLWYVQYFWGFYWATTIMMTVGFGDFLPNNYEEAYVTAFLQMISCIILAYNISEIGAIISRIRSINQETQRKLGLFERMSQEINNEPQNVKLKTRINNYLRESNYLKTHFEYEAMDELLNELPEHLRIKYIHIRNSKIFTDVPFFKNLKEQTIIELSQHFERQFFYPGGYLDRDQSDQKIKILEKGIIGLAFKRKGSMMNGKIYERIEVKEGMNPILLSKSFLKISVPIEYYHIADSYAMVWNIDYDNFLSVISSSTIDFQHYFSIVHKHSYTNQQWQTKICERCGSGELIEHHNVFQCPRLHFIPLKWVIISKYIVAIKSREQKRQPFRREENDLKKTSALKLRKLFFKEVQNFNIFSKKDIESNYEMEIVNQQERYEEEEMERRFQENQKIGQVNDFRFKELVNEAIRYYETGYEKDNFWDLKSDELNDYPFYFPNQNPNRLNQTSTSHSAQQIYWKNKTKSKKEMLDQRLK